MSAILEQFPLFQKLIDAEESYKAFSYMPSSTESDVYKKLPPEVGSGIDLYFNKLGKDFVLGFDVFADSSIKISARRRPSETEGMYIEENLSYYSAGSKMKQREFPVKDTILNKYWQYWALVNEHSLF